MNGFEVNPNTNRENVELMVENLFEYPNTIKTLRNPDALCEFEFEEMLALCLILTLFFPI